MLIIHIVGMITSGRRPDMFMRKAVTYFLYPVQSLDDLPMPIGEAIRPHLADDQIRSIIVIPPQDYAVRREETRWKKNLPFRWRDTPQRTLVFGDRQLVMVEAEKNGDIHSLVIPLDCLIYAGLATILLYAYLELVWVSGQQIEKRFIEYNAVGERLIRKQVEWARTQIVPRMPGFAHMPSSQTSAQLPFKFNNYLKFGLLPDENVLVAVHQPAIRRGEGWLQPYISPNRTVAITDSHLIILEEAERKRKSSYGIITRFIPLDRLQQAQFHVEAELCWLYLTLGFGDTTERLEIPLEAANSRDLRGAFNALHPVTA
jgi:hypothetical protein